MYANGIETRIAATGVCTSAKPTKQKKTGLGGLLDSFRRNADFFTTAEPGRLLGHLSF
jgi:hypothetical protein